MKKILVAMSGGVDSAVAAYLLKARGYDCIGVTMRLRDGTTDSAGSTCCSDEDVRDAAAVCASLGIPHYAMDFTGDFEDKVIRPFVRSYEMGLTPNPCIACNRHLKFSKLYETAQAMGCDALATGHYARIEQLPTGEYQLKKALDLQKEQSYVLYNLTQQQLSRTLFPLGELTKAEAREIAEREGLLNARKKDSQDICFIPDGDYAGFISRYTGKTFEPGAVLDVEGNVLGTHRGIIHYTVGQRKGLGLALGSPMYVKATDPETNTVILCRNDQLFSKTVLARDCNFIPAQRPEGPIPVTARIRYHHREQKAMLELLEDGKVRLTFDEPQRAVTPGQSVVFYQGDVVLGGAEITAGI